jgi:hypothetical protein
MSLHVLPHANWLRRITLLATFALLSLPGGAMAEQVKLDVVYVPTPYDAVHRMLELADVKPDDRLIDLGSGDGRIVIHAVRDWGVSDALGVEIDPRRIREANENARTEGVDDRVTFLQQDLFELDFSSATVLTMYLLEELNLRLRPVILEKLAPGTRVVAHVFGMGDWRPDEAIVVRGLDVFLWIVPAQVEGDWRIEMPGRDPVNINFEQRFQEVDGSYLVEGLGRYMTYVKLVGDEIRFSVGGEHFIGKVDDDVIRGVPGPGAVAEWRAVPR